MFIAIRKNTNSPKIVSFLNKNSKSQKSMESWTSSTGSKDSHSRLLYTAKLSLLIDREMRAF